MPRLSILIVPVLAFMSGCAVVAAAPREEVASGVPLTLGTSGPFYEQNYKLGERGFARVGEPIVRLREHYVGHRLFVQPSNDFTFKRSMLDEKHHFCASNEYPVSKTLTVDGAEYKAVDFGLFSLLVAEDGMRLKHDSAFASEGTTDIVVSPDTTTFASETRDRQYPGHQNFELVYSGTDGSSIKLLYREYSREDVARTAFFQELSFDKAQSTIVFRSLKIRVDEITPDGIAYTVLEDGLQVSAER